jgi:hypothetical protein
MTGQSDSSGITHLKMPSEIEREDIICRGTSGRDCGRTPKTGTDR